MKIFNFFRTLILSFFGLILLGSLCLLLIFQFESTQNYFLAACIKQLENETGLEIKIRKTAYTFPIHLTFEGIELSKADQSVAKIESTEIHLSFWKLLEGKIIFPLIHFSHVVVNSLPSFEGEGRTFIPFYIGIEDLKVDHLKISDQLDHDYAKEELKHWNASLNGTFKYNPFRSYPLIKFEISLREDFNEKTALLITLDLMDGQFSIDTKVTALSKEDLGIIETLDVKASSSFEHWKEVLQKKAKTPIWFEIEGRGSLYALPEPLSLEARILFTNFEKFFIKIIEAKSSLFSFQGETEFDNLQTFERGHFLATFNSPYALKGNAKIEGLLSGRLNHPEIELKVFPEMTWKEFTFDKMFFTKIEWDGDQVITLSPLNDPILGIDLNGSLEFSLENLMIKGELKSDLHELEHSFLWMETPVKGSASFKAFFSESKESSGESIQRIAIDAKGSHLTWKGHRLNEGLIRLEIEPKENEKPLMLLAGTFEGEGFQGPLVEFKNLKAEFKNESSLVNWREHHLLADLTFLKIKARDHQAEEVKTKVDLTYFDDDLKGEVSVDASSIESFLGKLAAFRGSSTLKGKESLSPFEWEAKNLEEVAIKAQGSWKDSEEQDLNLDLFEGFFEGFPLQLIQPVKLSFFDEKVTLSEGAIRWGEAELLLDLIKENDTLEAHFETNHFLIQQLHFLMPHLPLTGYASLQGSLGGTLSRPLGKIEAKIYDIQINDPFFKEKPLIMGHFLTDLEKNETKIEGEIKGLGPHPFLVQGSLPFVFNLEKAEMINLETSELDLTIQADGELDPYLDLFIHEFSNLTGEVSLKMFLKGPWKYPVITGFLDLKNGTFESLNTGALLHGITAHLEADGDEVRLTNFVAEDNNKGMIKSTGVLKIDPLDHFPFESTITASQIDLMKSDYATLSASGDLTLKGNMTKALLSGLLKIDHATIHLEEALPTQIKTVDVTHINLPEGELSSYSNLEEKKDFINMNISLELPENLTISGNNIHSEWNGKIILTGTVDDPHFDGDLHIVKGDYNLSGKLFNLSQGNIHFSGPLSKKTSLYIVASRDIETIQAEIILKGLISKPAISFRSNPPLSQREILSYILFNHGFSNITSAQSAQLTHSFTELRTSDEASSSSDLLSRIRNKIGIDRLDFGNSSDGENNYSLQIGKNITDNIAFSVNKSIMDAIYRYSVDVKLRKNLKAQAEVGIGDAYQLRTSIKWKHDY